MRDSEMGAAPTGLGDRAADPGISGVIAGRYRVIRHLGSGAMGEVFEVAHPSLPRNEAIKLVAASFASDAQFKSRFLREADVMATLMHPNIVTVFDRGEDESGRMWLAMELVNGKDAADILAAHGPMPISLVAEIVCGAGAALDFAWHTRKVTHRDVKPANIMVGLDERGNAKLVKLADFGIAKAAGGATELTSAGLTVGTLAYMSPEALEGRPLDGFADQYSLGCTAFTLLAGRSPYAAQSKAAILTGHLSRPVPKITALRPDLPAELDAVFQRVLAKRPANRFDSCTQFADAIRATTSKPSALTPAAKPTTLAPKPSKPLVVPAVSSGTGSRLNASIAPAKGRITDEPDRAAKWAPRTVLLIGGAVFTVALLAVVGTILATRSEPTTTAAPTSTANQAATTATAPNTVVKTIAVAGGSRSVAITPNGATAYAVNFDDDAVSVIDTATNTVTDTITVGPDPRDVAVTPDGTTAYVTSGGDDYANPSISVIDTATNSVTKTITESVEPAPGRVTVTADGAKAYVASRAGDTVSVIDTATNSVTKTITVGKSALSLAVSWNGATAYITNWGDLTDEGQGFVSVLDTKTSTITQTIAVGPYAYSVALTPYGATAYVTNRRGRSVSVIDIGTKTVIKTIGVGEDPIDVAVAPNGATAYVTNTMGSSISVIDTAMNSVTATIIVDENPNDVAITPNGAFAYVASLGGSVSVIASSSGDVPQTPLKYLAEVHRDRGTPIVEHPHVHVVDLT